MRWTALSFQECCPAAQHMDCTPLPMLRAAHEQPAMALQRHLQQVLGWTLQSQSPAAGPVLLRVMKLRLSRMLFLLLQHCLTLRGAP